MKGQSRDVDLKKSTSVRFPGALKALLGATARVAPGLTARRLANGFVTPMRAASPPRELEWQRGAAHHTVRCGDYELAVRSRGLGGPQVLLVHGWSGRGSQLGAFVEPLVEQGFEVNWFDLPAHGASSGAQAGMPQAIAAVEAVVEWLGGADTVIAHSMGSAATTLAASRGAAIGRMVYLSPPDDVGSYLWVVGRLLGLPEGIIGRAQKELEARFQVRFADLLPSLVAPSMRQSLLAFHDLDDREVTREEVERVIDLWPHAELRLTEGLGHRRILRDPQVIAQVVEHLTGRPTGRRRAA